MKRDFIEGVILWAFAMAVFLAWMWLAAICTGKA